MMNYVMKAQFLILLSALMFLSGCSKSDSFSDLALSESSFSSISSEGGTFSVDLTCSTSWSVNSDAQWCKPNKSTGSGDAVLTLTVAANLQQAARTATVTVTSGSVTKTVQLSQLSSDGSEYHYKLPVIFHVLYENANDNKQFVDKGRIADIVKKVNEYYKGHLNNVDINLEFVLPETDPYGNTLDEPGVERIKFDGTYPIDEEQFMTDNTGRYKYLLWDPNEYINVMVYNFASDGGNIVTLGISHLPYTTSENTLPGLNTANAYLTLDNLKYAHCVSINSSYIYYQSGEKTYSTADVTVTLAHELGHYLGLHHAFTEDAEGCEDTDYCADTPSYDRNNYVIWAEEELKQQPDNTLAHLAQRTNCNGVSFVAHNMMDYYYCYSDQFTADQRARIRNVLTYSPLIPGPKMTTRTRTVVEGLIDLPVRVMK